MKRNRFLALVLALVLVLALFAGCGSKPETPAPAPDSGTVTQDPDTNTGVDWWLGGWYGWWVVFDGDGYYYDFINYNWDCCVYIEPSFNYEDGYLLSIWDTDLNDYYESCIAEVELTFAPTAGGGDKGAMVSTEGYFWYGDVEDGDWLIDPDDADHEDMFTITSSFVDMDGEYCEFGVVLTRWGVPWDENAVAAPHAYYDYFLPLIEEGEDIPFVIELP